ncbi:MAG: outer membrane beta-barrel protein [Candidatus Wallbacteria bacterium]|nr:outer membrane beta-barrel protein [Candidatus Wallbacteria bacterium]
MRRTTVQRIETAAKGCGGLLWLAVALAIALVPSPSSARELRTSGWIDVSYSASSARTSARPVSFNDQVDDAMLQQLWLKVELPVPVSGSGWGFRSESIVSGADYRFTRARGLFDRQDGHSGFDPVQFHVEGSWPGQGLTLKLGRFNSPYGAETIAAPSNPLASHSHSFTYNPFTHTGALATKTAGEWSYTLGALAGCDVFIDDASRPMLFAGVAWTEPVTAAADVVAVGSILGSSRFDVARNFNNPNIVDVVWTHPLTARLTTIVEGLAGWQSNLPGIGETSWKGLVGYLTFAWKPGLTPALRLELFDDEHGNRTGFAGRYSSATLGLAWQAAARLLVRPEIRHDSNDASTPWDGQDEVTTVSASVLYRW